MELVNYPRYRIYPDNIIWSDKNENFMKADKKGFYTLTRKWEQKRVHINTIKYEQTHICKYDNIIQTLFQGREKFIFHGKLRGIKNIIFKKRFNTVEEALLYKFFFLLKLESATDILSLRGFN